MGKIKERPSFRYIDAPPKYEEISSRFIMRGVCTNRIYFKAFRMTAATVKVVDDVV